MEKSESLVIVLIKGEKNAPLLSETDIFVELDYL